MARSRAGRALIASGFAYAQFGSAIVVGILLVPLMLDQIGARLYGLWLATGELLGYVGLLDLGVFAVLPWMIAEADGRRDRAAIRRFVVHGLLVGVAVALLYLGAVALAWHLLPDLFGLSAGDRARLAGPLTLLVLVTAATYPLYLFLALLNGLQDFTFSGALALVQAVLRAGLTLGLLFAGAGLYALTIGAAAPLVVALVAGMVRAWVLAPDLFRVGTRPSWRGVVTLFREGIGGWLAGFGWKLGSASYALVITALGAPVLVPVFVCTAKLSQLLTNLSWVLPDSGLVGLAQIHGEGRVERVREVAGGMLSLLLVLAGGVVCLQLALNPAFVHLWVGAEFFGGLRLNILLAALVMLSSLVHGLNVVESVLGFRLRVGVAVLIGGAVQFGLALLLGRWWGLQGVAAAALVSALLTTLPAGLVLLRPATGLSPRWLLGDVVLPWLGRVWPILLAALAFGMWHRGETVWLPVGVTTVLGLAYLWGTRAIYEDLPLPPQVRRWLAFVRLAAPTPAAVPSGEAQS